MAPAASRLLPSAMGATATGRSLPLHSEVVGAVGTTQQSRGRVWFDETRGAVTLFLDQSLCEVEDPYGGPPVRLQPVVVSTDGDQVLFMLQSSHGAIPNQYFVCSVQGGNPVRLPHLPEVLLPGSMGLLKCSNGSYLVAHLSVTPDQKTGWITQGSLHLWEYNPSSSSASPKAEVPWTPKLLVTLPLVKRTKWHNNRVISLGKDLMFVDLKQGILRMILSDDGKPPRFQFVGLPKNLPLFITNPWRNDRPEMFRNVGRCSGKLEFINLHTHLGNTNNVEVSIWTLDLKNRKWIEDNDINVNRNINCRDLWAKLQRTHTTPLPPWPNSVPISPFLMRDEYNSSILCLTVVEENNKKAWLLQIDMKTITPKDATEYPRYYSHMKQPFLINSSSVTPKRTM